MKHLRFKVQVTAVTVLLVGCAGLPTPMRGALPPEQMLRVGANHFSLSGERFQASNVHLKAYDGGCIGGDIWIDFTAVGAASGPYPGTFKAKGSWFYVKGWVSGEPNFSETFTITSKTSISGNVATNDYNDLKINSCRLFRSHRERALDWYVNSSTGPVIVTNIEKGLLQQSFR